MSRTSVRYVWTKDMDAYITANWGSKSPKSIRLHLGVGNTALKGRVRKLGLPSSSGYNRHVWTSAELRKLTELYADTRTDRIAALLGLRIDSIYKMAYRLGLEKSAAFLASDASGRLRKLTSAGAQFRFTKGHVPRNKGVKGWQAGGGSVETQFRKGQKPGNWLPIGALRLSKEGYLQVKMTDTGYPPRDWVAMHNLVWELHHGAIPPGHRVAFLDGDRYHDRVEPANLELVTFADMMRRNTIHNYPKEIVQVVLLRGVVNRKINQRIKANEQ